MIPQPSKSPCFNSFITSSVYLPQREEQSQSKPSCCCTQSKTSKVAASSQTEVKRIPSSPYHQACVGEKPSTKPCLTSPESRTGLSSKCDKVFQIVEPSIKKSLSRAKSTKSNNSMDVCSYCRRQANEESQVESTASFPSSQGQTFSNFAANFSCDSFNVCENCRKNAGSKRVEEILRLAKGSFQWHHLRLWYQLFIFQF